MLNSGSHDNIKSLEKGHYVVLHSQTNKQTKSVVKLVVWGFHWTHCRPFSWVCAKVAGLVDLSIFLNIMAMLNVLSYPMMLE